MLATGSGLALTMRRRRFAASWRWRLVTLAAVLALLLPAGTASANVSNEGGVVIPNPALYIVFWGGEWTFGSNQFPQYQQYMTYLTDFFTNIGGNPWLNTVQQYGAQNPSGQLLGTWIDDSTEPPTAPQQADIDGEARATLLHFLGGFFNQFPNDGTVPLNTIVLVALPSGHDPSDFGVSDCAWHSSDTTFMAAGTMWPFAYIELPWQTDKAGCADAGDTLGPIDSFGHNTLDGVSFNAGHEYAEAISDPYGNGWYDPTGVAANGTNQGEIGDLCNGIAGDHVTFQGVDLIGMDSILVGPQYYGVTQLFSNAANGGAGGPELQCTLGAGVAPQAQWSTTSLDFGLATVGGAGVTRTATLQNAGTAELAVAAVGGGEPVFIDPTILGTFPQDFQIAAGTNSCATSNSTLGSSVSGLGAVLFPQPGPPYQQCSLNVTFTPSTAGPETAFLKVDSNDPNAPGGQTILKLSGAGVPTNVRYTKASVNFGATLSTLVGGVEGVRQIVGLTNSDTVPHVLGGLGFAGTNPDDFGVISNGCSGLTLPPGQTCDLTLLFRPNQTGPREAILQVVDSTTGSIHELPLAGTGLGPILNVRSGPNTAPTVALNFGDVRAGTRSAPQPLTLTNTGQADLRIQSIVASGDFRVLDTNCPLVPNTLAINGSCTIEVALAAVHGGAETGTLAIAANANNSPRKVFLSGQVVAPAAAFSARSLSFSAFVSQSSSQQVRLSDTGTAPLTMSSIATSGPFTQTSNCPLGSTTALGPQSCAITITFTPTTCGPASGSLTVADDALPSGAQTLPLSGYGACILRLGAFVIGDGNAAVGSPVTFWGDRWSAANQLSGGPAPAAFKGYADTLQTNPPACGQPWSEVPGAGAAPPATVPRYIAVIVAARITKEGSAIGGQHIAHIAIVRVNPGYAPKPGHRGTGTVVGMLC